jgi:prevent-host-death family protein
MPSDMHLRFQLLPMTELRTRPGEILDRVADGEEAFIIERNGHQKACLVPLAVFLPNISPSRIAQEVDELVKNGEEPRTTVTKEREIAFRFRQALDGGTYAVTIVLPHGYPNTCPRIYADLPEEDVPHRWVDGALCVFGVMSAWNPGKHTAASALVLTRRWLRNYETWRQTRQWPKPGPHNG